MVAFVNMSRPRRTSKRRLSLAECPTPPAAKAKTPRVVYGRVDQSFKGFNNPNAMLILDQLETLRGCDCQPYFDVFTFGRWQALGCSVKKGERGIKIPTVIRNGEQRHATVFCRCQVVDV